MAYTFIWSGNKVRKIDAFWVKGSKTSWYLLPSNDDPYIAFVKKQDGVWVGSVPPNPNLVQHVNLQKAMQLCEDVLESRSKYFTM